MSTRGVIIALAAIGIPTALLMMLLPVTWGYGGMLEAERLAREAHEASDPRGMQRHRS